MWLLKRHLILQSEGPRFRFSASLLCLEEVFKSHYLDEESDINGKEAVREDQKCCC